MSICRPSVAASSWLFGRFFVASLLWLSPFVPRISISVSKSKSLMPSSPPVFELDGCEDCPWEEPCIIDDVCSLQCFDESLDVQSKLIQRSLGDMACGIFELR